jgi:hypothetical protein
MRFSRRRIAFLGALALARLTVPAVAADFGEPKDVKEVRRRVAAKFGHALHASVSHDWALCTAYRGNEDVSVVLQREASVWKIVAHDGGAYGKEDLKALGIPEDDVQALLKAYQ